MSTTSPASPVSSRLGPAPGFWVLALDATAGEHGPNEGRHALDPVRLDRARQVQESRGEEVVALFRRQRYVAAGVVYAPHTASRSFASSRHPRTLLPDPELFSTLFNDVVEVSSYVVACDAGLQRQPLLYPSLCLKRHRQKPYRLLGVVRLQGDWEAWLEFVLQGVAKTAGDAVGTAERLVALFRSDEAQLDEWAGGGASLHRVFNALRLRLRGRPRDPERGGGAAIGVETSATTRQGGDRGHGSFALLGIDAGDGHP